VFSWMEPLRLNIFLFGAAKLQIWTKSPQSSFFSSARISELSHKFRLKWVRLKFQAEDFVGIQYAYGRYNHHSEMGYVGWHRNGVRGSPPQIHHRQTPRLYDLTDFVRWLLA
jgi:hypothetical protein